jgi:hypothetical protein
VRPALAASSLSAVLAIVLSSCAGSSSDYAHTLAERSAGVSEAYSAWPSSIISALPSTQYEMPSGNFAAFSELVVVGRFSEWERGKAKSWATQDGQPAPDEGIIVPWSSKDAWTRNVLLTLDVEFVIAGQNPRETIRVWLAVDGSRSAEGVADGLVNEGRVVVFLEHPTDPSHSGDYKIALENALVGALDDNGNFKMPVLDAARRAWPESALGHLKVDATTISELRREAAQRRRVSLQQQGAPHQ